MMPGIRFIARHFLFLQQPVGNIINFNSLRFQKINIFAFLKTNKGMTSAVSYLFQNIPNVPINTD